MPEQSKRGRAQDRAKVAGGQKHETAYEANKTQRRPARRAKQSRRSATPAARSRPT